MTRRELEQLPGAILSASLAVLGMLWTVTLNRRSIGFAFGINWALMGGAFIIWHIVPIRFGRGYYRVRRFEASGAVYERLGVRFFQRVLRSSGFLAQNPYLRYRPGPGAADALVAATYDPETAHALIFVVIVWTAGDAVRRGWWDTAAWLLLFNVAFNAYPVFSLRYVRARVQRLNQPPGRA